jgi:hypothetical protein
MDRVITQVSEIQLPVEGEAYHAHRAALSDLELLTCLGAVQKGPLSM